VRESWVRPASVRRTLDKIMPAAHMLHGLEPAAMSAASTAARSTMGTSLARDCRTLGRWATLRVVAATGSGNLAWTMS